MYRIGMVAGEASGDILGGELIRALRALVPDAVIEGIGGRCMEHEGCSLLYPVEKLSVMGLFEVIGRYRELVNIRNTLISHFVLNPPDVFIGIDAPDFNLGLEDALHRHKIRTVHYVSPQVWAWREYRLKKIKKAVDLMLVLLPFEKEYYDRHNIPTIYVGHPAADRVVTKPDKLSARARLGLPLDKKIIAIMPGSRDTELRRLLSPFLLTAQWCINQRQDLHFVTSLLDTESVEKFNRAMKNYALENLPVSLYIRRTDDVLEAADVALLASGTVTLEAMLYQLPMVVGYKMNPLSFALISAMVKVRHAALPNLLSGKEIVPEYLQGNCRPEKLGKRLLEWMEDYEGVAKLRSEFAHIHGQLKQDASRKAAESVIELLQSP